MSTTGSSSSFSDTGPDQAAASDITLGVESLGHAQTSSADQLKISEALHSLQVHQEELKAQNEQLRQTQIRLEQIIQKYHDLFENTPAAYFILDSSYCVQDVNATGMDMLGRPKRGIIGKPFLLFVRSDSRRDLDAHFQQVRTGTERVSTEIWISARQDEEIPVILLSTALGSSWGRSWHCLTTTFPITDRKNAEIALQASEARFRAIFEQNPLAVQILDACGESRMTNRAWTRLWGGHGRAPGGGAALPAAVMKMDPFVRQAFDGHSVAVPATHIPGQGRGNPDLWIQGNVYPIQALNGAIHEVVVVHDDITERKRIEIDLSKHTTLLQRQYDNLRALSEIAALPSAIGAHRQLCAALDLGCRNLGLNTGLICQVNEDIATIMHHSTPDGSALADGAMIPLEESFCAMVVHSGEVIALPNVSQSPHADHPAHRQHGVESFLGAPVRFRGQLYGTLTFRSNAPLPRSFDEGDIEFIRLMARLVGAILEQDESRRDLAKSNAELEQFAYVASHDLRQPLRQVSSYVSLLQRRYGDQLDDTAREFISFAHQGAVRMDNLIVDLLEFSRIGRANRPMEAVDLGRVMAESIANLGGILGESGGQVVIDTPLPVVRGEPSDLTRLFQNLIGNAVKYRDCDRPPEIHVAAATQGGDQVISVQDNGIGIEPEYFDTIFRIFQRLHTPDKFEGTGIGLAICKKVVEQHQGRIWVESVPGQGTTFFVALPNRI